MEKTLGEIFTERQGTPFFLEEKLISMALALPVATGQVVEIEFLSNQEACKQGIAMSVDKRKGSIQVVPTDGDKIRHPVFWTHTAPKKFSIQCFPKKTEGEVLIWNIWKSLDFDRTDAWIGNAGMYIQEQGDHSWVCHCSNGIGEVDFEDLVFRVRLLS